ncbi:hypothetical protein J4214_00345 [Candidatus Woesearchaeota archaeon]|nr:hypothetical protein [Candidatus Woesearchaeota archaeon]
MMVAQEFQELLQFIVGINNHLVKIRKHIERENPENKSELTKCVGNTRNNLVILADYVDNLNHDHNRLISFFRTFKTSLLDLIDRGIFSFNNEQEKKQFFEKMSGLEEKIIGYRTYYLIKDGKSWHYSIPIVVRFDSVFHIESFLINGYQNKEGFYRKNGTFPLLFMTMEDNATHIVENDFDENMQKGFIDGCWQFAYRMIIKLILFKGGSGDDLNEELYQYYRKGVLNIFNINSEDYNNIMDIHMEYESILKSLHQKSRFIEEKLLNNPEFILQLHLSYFPGIKRYHNVYDLAVILYAAKTQINKGVTVLNAIYFNCNKDALIGLQIIHKNPILRDLVKNYLLKIYNKTRTQFPIFDVNFDPV